MRIYLNDLEPRVITKLDKSMNNDRSRGITLFGEKNDYPETIERLILGSQNAIAISRIYASFLAGGGFANDAINKAVVGTDLMGYPITVHDILSAAADSISRFQGFYLKLIPNLLGNYSNAELLPFKKLRLGYIDNIGYNAMFAFANDWQKVKKSNITWYNNYNSNPVAIAKQLENDNFNGQVYACFFDKSYIYPLSTFDSVYMDLDTDAQMQVYKNNQVRNGFCEKTILVVDEPEDEKDKKELHNDIEHFLGVDGSNLLLLSPTKDSNGNVIPESAINSISIKSNINDKLFEGWNSELANNIRKVKNVPAILIDYESSNLGTTSGESINAAVDFMNATTKKEREKLSLVFKMIFSKFENPEFKTEDWSIKPLTLFDNGNTINLG